MVGLGVFVGLAVAEGIGVSVGGDVGTTVGDGVSVGHIGEAVGNGVSIGVGDRDGDGIVFGRAMFVGCGAVDTPHASRNAAMDETLQR